MSFSRDTSPQAATVVAGLLRGMTLGRRLAMADEHFATGRVMTLSALKWRYPDATDEEIEAHYVRMILGRELGTRVLAARHARRRNSGVA